MNKAKLKTKDKDPSWGLFLVLFLVIWEKAQKTNLYLILKQYCKVFYSISIQQMWKQRLRETITLPNLMSTEGEFKPSPDLAQRLSFLGFCYYHRNAFQNIKVKEKNSSFKEFWWENTKYK